MRTLIALFFGLLLGLMLSTVLPERYLSDLGLEGNDAEGATHAGHDDVDVDDDADDADDVPVRDRGIAYDGVRAVALTPAERALADIQSVEAQIETVTPAFLARAEVTNAAPALALTGRIRALSQELAVQRETEQAIEERLAAMKGAAASPAERLRLTGELRQARRERIALAAELVQAEVTLSESFGPLAGALQANSELARALSGAEAALLLLTLPVGERLPDGTRTLQIGADSGDVERSAAVREAQVLTPAPSTSGVSLGGRYFLKVAGSDWVPGMLLTAKIPDPSRVVDGVRVPRSAVVWHQGLRWVYTEPEAGVFVRRQIREVAASDDGMMVIALDLAGNPPIVTQGAQALLAEEFRTAIPEEDED